MLATSTMQDNGTLAETASDARLRSAATCARWWRFWRDSGEVEAADALEVVNAAKGTPNPLTAIRAGEFRVKGYVFSTNRERLLEGRL